MIEELECRESLGFSDQQTYDEKELKSILGAEKYTAGIRYTEINRAICPREPTTYTIRTRHELDTTLSPAIVFQ